MERYDLKEGKSVFIFSTMQMGTIKSIRERGSVQTIWVDVKEQDEMSMTAFKGSRMYVMPRVVGKPGTETLVLPITMAVDIVGVMLLAIFALNYLQFM